MRPENHQILTLKRLLTTFAVVLGNPLQEKHAADGDWHSTVSSKNKTIKKLDGETAMYNLKRTGL